MTALAAWMALAAAAAAAGPADPVAGRWQGRSLCQVRGSACRDEHVVYHVAVAGTGRYRIAMDKIVGGAEQEMGILDAAFDSGAGRLTAETQDRAGRPAAWTFRVSGEAMEGRLVLGAGQLYRLISLRRAPAR